MVDDDGEFRYLAGDSRGLAEVTREGVRNVEREPPGGHLAQSPQHHWLLEQVQSIAQKRGDLDWVASIDSTIVRVHQHGATLPRTTGGSVELQEVRRRAS